MPDLVTGKEYHAEVTILRQDYSNDPAAVAAGHGRYRPGCLGRVQLQRRDTESERRRSQFSGHDNEFLKFDITFKGIIGEDRFSIMSGGTSDDPQGLLIDYIKINEWGQVCTR